MGGQACVFYGAVQFSKDVDLALLAEPENYRRVLAALAELNAELIGVPRFDPELLRRGHAVHFRCSAAGVEKLRIDFMTRMRGVPDFALLWERRTVLQDDAGTTFDIMAVSDLVRAKKTQRDKDWPMIEALVDQHYHQHQREASPEQVRFWLLEMRTPENLILLARRYRTEVQWLASERPLLKLVADEADLETLRSALDLEMRVEQSRDRAYWEPLKKELEQFRRDQRR